MNPTWFCRLFNLFWLSHFNNVSVNRRLQWQMQELGTSVTNPTRVPPPVPLPISPILPPCLKIPPPCLAPCAQQPSLCHHRPGPGRHSPLCKSRCSTAAPASCWPPQRSAALRLQQCCRSASPTGICTHPQSSAWRARKSNPCTLLPVVCRKRRVFCSKHEICFQRTVHDGSL
jgi:hypothetical protein